MKLLTEITDLLMSESGSLTEALLKTKVLLHRIGQAKPEMIGWVSSELTGYSSLDSLPEYRKLYGSVRGNLSNGVYRYPGTLVPLSHLERQHQEMIQASPMPQSLAVLEKLVNDAKSGNSLVAHLEPEICALVGEGLGNGYYIESAWTRIEISQVRQILTEVRSRLLDFVLELQTELGGTVTDDDARTVAAKIDVSTLFQGAVIGPNATFQINGNNNQQSVNNTNISGDFNAIADDLRKANVSEDDITELQSAITADSSHPVAKSHYGPQVTVWLRRMVGKAVSGAWGVNVAIATNVLTTAIERYYGLS